MSKSVFMYVAYLIKQATHDLRMFILTFFHAHITAEKPKAVKKIFRFYIQIHSFIFQINEL